MRRLRQCVIRDLETLFNCPAPSGDENYDDDALIAASTLNYGMPNLAGCYASGLDIKALEQRIRESIRAFEPRLVRSSVKVSAQTSADEHGVNAVVFIIEAEIWSHPEPERVTLRAHMALETGQVVVQEISGHGGR